MKMSFRSGAIVTTIVAAGAVATWIHPTRAIAQGTKPSAGITLTRNVDEPGLNPYQSSHNTFFLANTFAITEDLPVPAGRTVVVEHVSLSGALTTGSVPRAFVRCITGAMEVNHSIALTPQGDVNGLTVWAASQPIKCFAATNNTLTTSPLSIHVQTGTLQTLQPSWVVAASGYTVDQ
jgi:hypothetical protein